MNRIFTIGEAARAAGVNVETIRFYERQGLLKRPEKPSGSGARRYGEDAVRRVGFIKEAQKLGFSLREIDELLALHSSPNADCADVRMRALAKIEDIRSKMAKLARIDAELERLVAACCGEGGLEHCAIMNALISRATPSEASVETAASVSFRVTGMKCQGCATSLKMHLENAPGIIEARVSFRKRTVALRCDPALADHEEIVQTIKRLGFGAERIA